MRGTGLGRYGDKSVLEKRHEGEQNVDGEGEMYIRQQKRQN